MGARCIRVAEIPHDGDVDRVEEVPPDERGRLDPLHVLDEPPEGRAGRPPLPEIDPLLRGEVGEIEPVVFHPFGEKGKKRLALLGPVEALPVDVEGVAVPGEQPAGRDEIVGVAERRARHARVVQLVRAAPPPLPKPLHPPGEAVTLPLDEAKESTVVRIRA